MTSSKQIRFVDVWQAGSPEHHESVKHLWKSLGLMNGDAEINRRLQQLCFLAFDKDQLVGVSTTRLETLPNLRASFYLFRCLVLPQYRRQGVARGLTRHCRDRLSDWSRENPDPRACGMATIVESLLLSELSRLPVWPASGLTLIGHTEIGQQIRVVWFDHARLE